MFASLPLGMRMMDQINGVHIESETFKSDIFTTNPFSDDVFVWDEDNIVEYPVSNIELHASGDRYGSGFTFAFSSIKSLLLGKVKLGVQGTALNLCLDITGTATEYGTPFTGRSKSIFLEEGFIRFERPILSKPKVKYLFNLWIQYPTRSKQFRDGTDDPEQVEFGVGTDDREQKEKVLYNGNEVSFSVKTHKIGNLIDTLYVMEL